MDVCTLDSSAVYNLGHVPAWNKPLDNKTDCVNMRRFSTGTASRERNVGLNCLNVALIAAIFAEISGCNVSVEQVMVPTCLYADVAVSKMFRLCAATES